MKTLSGIILAIALSALKLSAQSFTPPQIGPPPTNPTNAYVMFNDRISYDGGNTWSNMFSTNLWIYTTQFTQSNPPSMFIVAKHSDLPVGGPKLKTLYVFWSSTADLPSITNLVYGCIVYLPQPEMTNAAVTFKPWCQYVPKAP